MAEIDNGTYIGTGEIFFLIDGLGFRPEVVIVKGDNGESAVIRTDFHALTASKKMTAPGDIINDGILGFYPDGFAVGGGPGVNDGGTEYSWVAFSEDPGTMSTGEYTGNGDIDHNIFGVGMQPAVVMVISDGNEPVQFRTIDMPDDFGTSFEADGMYGNALEYFFNDGFRVGSNPSVNELDRQYGYIAFAWDPDKVVYDWYTGDGSPGRSHGPLGFGPDYVIVKAFDPIPAVQRMKGQADPMSSHFHGEGNIPNGIIDVKADHFDVGNSNRTNQAPLTYYYVAFNNRNWSADLGLTQMVDNATPDVGQEITFDISLLNDQGPDIANNVKVRVDLPPGLTYTGDTPSQGSFDDVTGFWVIGDLGIDNTVNLTLTARVDLGYDGQTLEVITSVANMDQSDPDGTDNHTTTLVFVGGVSVADLALSMAADNLTPDVGDDINYTVDLVNNGPSDAHNITVDITAGNGLDFWDFSLDDGSYNQGQTEWTIPTLASGGSTQLRLVYRPDTGTEGATLTLSADTIAADETDPDGSNNIASVDVDVNSNTIADLTVSASWDDTSPAEGQQVQLTVNLDNLGPDSADNITVLVQLPSGLTLDSDVPDSGTYNQGSGLWNVPVLANGTGWSLNIWATVEAGMAGSTLTTTPEIIGSNQIDSDGSNNSASASLTVSNAELMLAMTVDDLTPDEGQDITYYVVLTNNGPDVATDIKVDLTFPDGLVYQSHTHDPGSYNHGLSHWTIPSLGVGLTAQLRVTTRVVAGTGGQTLTTLADITEVAESDSDGSNNSASVDVEVTSADLAVAIGVDDSAPDEGQQVIYTIGLENQGPQDATGTAVEITLPPGLTYVGNTPSIGSFNSGTRLWTIGPVAAMENFQLQITATVDAGTAGSTLTTTAAVANADQGDPDGLNNTASVDVTVTSADLAVAIGVDNPGPDEGQQLVYTIALDNLGPDDATGTAVTVSMPPGLTYVSDTPGTGTYNSGTGLWTIGPVSAAGVATLQVTASVDLGTGGLVLTTTAAVSAADQGDPDSSNNSASVGVLIPVSVSEADLLVALAVDDNAPDVGQQVTFTVGLVNLGPDTATGTEMTFSLPAGLTYVSDTPGAGGFDSGTGIWTPGSLPAMGSIQLQLVATVDAGTGGSTLATGAAISAAGQTDPNPANNSSSVDVFVGAVLSADLAVSLAADVTSAIEAEQIVYTLDLDNQGPDDAGGIEVNLMLPVGLTYVSDTATIGSFNSGNGVWTVGSLVATGSAQLQVTASVDAGTAESTLTTTAAVTGADVPDPFNANNSATAGVDILSSANLGVTAAFDNFNPLPGDPSVLTVVLTNSGPNTASGIQVDMVLSPELFIDVVRPTNGSWNGGTGAWNLTSLAPSATDTLFFDLTVGDVAGGTELTATAAIATMVEFDPDTDDNSTRAAMIVRAPGEVRLVAEPFEDSHRTLLPGGPIEDVLRLALINDSAFEKRLQSITISNPVTGSFDQDTQDAAWEKMELSWSLEAKAEIEPHIFGGFVNGQLTFAGLDIGVKPGVTLHLVVRGSVSVDAADGLGLQPTINSADDLEFTSAVFLEGTWPIIAPGYLFVDGMTAAQITLHQVGAEVFQIGSVRNPALDMTLPANGGIADVLTKLNILNTGTANYPGEIDRMECWADNGDGIFNAATDTWMAELRWTGAQRFEASALNENVPPAGLRVFVTVDIAEDALGGTLRLSLPTGDDLGVGMASDNDGPIDRAVTNPLAQTISATDRVIITTAPLSSRTVAPGDSRVPLLHLVARNLYADDRTMRRLDLNNVTVGDPIAGQTELDQTMEQLVIQWDGDLDGELDGPEIDPVIVATTWENGVATFDGLGWVLSPDQVSHLFVTANIDLNGAANGDIIGAVVGAAQDVEFDETTVVVGGWPVDSGARYEVDGMVAAQVACPAVPPVSLTANEGPVVALDITVPGNGYLDDTLQTLRLQNIGTAVPADISALELYDDQNGNGIFEPGTDAKLADFTGIGQDWVVLDVALPIPADGRRLFAGLTVAATPTDSATVRLSVPVNGLDMVSGNDGPYDVAVTSPTSLLMSTAPLLSNLAFEYGYSTTEMTVTATMTVKNVGGEDVLNITPEALVVNGDGAMNEVSGPQPAFLDLVQGAEGTFTWVMAGQRQGPVFVSSSCEGNGAVGGQPRGSLPSGSAMHVILDPALDLNLYPVANMPFSINRGQTGVVPMTLTLLNPGGPERANLRLEQLVVTLDDGDGNPVVPAELLSHVTVNEGANIYCDRGTLETSGQTMTLVMDPPVVVTDSEPVTLGLRLDILADTAVDRFRVILMEAGDLTILDNVSGLPRTVLLSSDSFPVMSAAGSIVSQANGLIVSAPVQSDLTAGAGQEDVTLLQLELAGTGDDDASEVKVGGFAITVVDILGQTLADPSAYLSNLWVEGPLGINAIHDVTGPADSLVVFELLPQVTVPVGSLAVDIAVHGRLPENPVLGPFQLRLAPTNTFDARDGNNSADVLVTYQPSEITGPRVTIQEPAAELMVAVTGELPDVTSLGAADVLAMTVILEHPGPGTAASVRLDSLYLDCLDLNRLPQDPDAILDGYRVFYRGLDLGAPIFYQNQQVVVPLGGHLLDPLTQGDLELRIDVEANAPAGGFELVVPLDGIVAFDSNLGTPVPLVPAPGYTLPAGSNLTRLQPPSEDVVADWEDRMPPLMPTDDVRVEAMRLVLTNPAPNGAAPAEFTSLVLRAANRNGQPLAAGTVLSGIEVEYEGSVWAEITEPVAGDSTLTLVGFSPLTLHPNVTESFVVKVSGRSGAAIEGLSLGLLDGDVVCVQPGSTTLVSVSPVAGETFPFWTAAAGFGKAALADSYINFPNPFAAGREQTSFAFNLDQPATVTLCIWTPRGETVTTLLNNKPMAAGLVQDLIWDGRNGGGQAVRNGVYLAELKVQYQGGGSERLLRKVAVVR